MSYFYVSAYHCLPVFMFYPVIPTRQIPCLPLFFNIIISEMITNGNSFTQSKPFLFSLDLSILPFLGIGSLSNHGTERSGAMVRCQLRGSLTGHFSPGRAAPNKQSPMTFLPPSLTTHIRAHPKCGRVTKLQEGQAPVHRVQTPPLVCSKPRPPAQRLLSMCRQTPCGQQAHLHVSK